MVYRWMCLLFFCFKQKTAYEMRISDWSSDVCSSDLCDDPDFPVQPRRRGADVRDVGVPRSRPVVPRRRNGRGAQRDRDGVPWRRRAGLARLQGDRKSVVEGTSVSVRVDLGGGRIMKKKH